MLEADASLKLPDLFQQVRLRTGRRPVCIGMKCEPSHNLFLCWLAMVLSVVGCFVLYIQALVDVMEGTTNAAEEAGTDPDKYVVWKVAHVELSCTVRAMVY